MSRHQLSRAAFALLGAAALAACAEDTTAPKLRRNYDASVDNNAVLVEVGEHRSPLSLVVPDPQAGLVLLYRWDDGFCGGTQPTEFILSTYHDVIRVDDLWHTLDKTDGFWFYVYAWNGVSRLNCAFFRNTPKLATGRGHRLLHDNDYYPFEPFGPGPGGNAYFVEYRATLSLANGDPVEFGGQTHATVLPDGETFRHWDTTLHLSPDPRR